MSSYNVLLSYPNASDPNKIYILDNNGRVVFESPVMEKAFLPEENDTDVVQPFNAYSAPGIVTVSYIYK